MCHNWERELQHGYRSYTVRPYLNVYSSMSRLHTVWGAGGGYLNSLQSRLQTDHTCLRGDSIILCQINDLPACLAGWRLFKYFFSHISHHSVPGWAGLGWAAAKQHLNDGKGKKNRGQHHRVPGGVKQSLAVCARARISRILHPPPPKFNASVPTGA